MVDTLRSCMVAEPDYTFICMDASQLELRVVAILSKDPLMLESLTAKDLHLATAIQVFGWTDDEDEMKHRRYNAKQLNFAILYGADAYKVSEMADCTVIEAEELIAQYFRTYYILKAWIDEAKRLAKVNGFVTNLFGRIRPIPELNSSSWSLREKGEREAINTIVQGTAVDIVKLMMLYLRGLLDKSIRLVLQVHDEMVWEIPDRLLEDTIHKAQSLVTVFPDYPCTIKVGKVYGEVKDYKEEQCTQY